MEPKEHVVRVTKKMKEIFGNKEKKRRKEGRREKENLKAGSLSQ
jgi:hypothetical protein